MQVIIFKYILFVISKQSQDLFIKILVFSIFLIAKVVQQFLSILTKCCNYKVQSSDFSGSTLFFAILQKLLSSDFLLLLLSR